MEEENYDYFLSNKIKAEKIYLNDRLLNSDLSSLHAREDLNDDISSLQAMHDYEISSLHHDIDFKDLDLDSDVSSLIWERFLEISSLHHDIDVKDLDLDNDISSLIFVKDNEMSNLRLKDLSLDSDVSSLQRIDQGLDSDVSSLQQIDQGLDSDVSSLHKIDQGLDNDVSSLHKIDQGIDSDVSSLQQIDQGLDSDVSSLHFRDSGHDSDVSSLHKIDQGLDSNVSSLHFRDSGHDSDISSLDYKDEQIDSDISSMQAMHDYEISSLHYDVDFKDLDLDSDVSSLIWERFLEISSLHHDIDVKDLDLEQGISSLHFREIHLNSDVSSLQQIDQSLDSDVSSLHFRDSGHDSDVYSLQQIDQGLHSDISSLHQWINTGFVKNDSSILLSKDGSISFVPTMAGSDFSNHIAISMWLKPTDRDLANGESILETTNFGSDNAIDKGQLKIAFYKNNGNPTMQIESWDGATQKLSTHHEEPIISHGWNHIFILLQTDEDSVGGLQLFLNGNAHAHNTGGQTFQDLNNGWSIGGFKGFVNEFAMLNLGSSNLSESEIETLATTIWGGGDLYDFSQDNRTKVWWRMGDSAGDGDNNKINNAIDALTYQGTMNNLAAPYGIKRLRNSLLQDIF